MVVIGGGGGGSEEGDTVWVWVIMINLCRLVKVIKCITDKGIGSPDTRIS